MSSIVRVGTSSPAGVASSKTFEDVTRTVWAATPSPESGLSPVSTTGADSAAALQAILNYVDTTYGVGRVVLPGATVKCNSGVTVPDLVTLAAIPGGHLDFSGMSASGTAVTVNWPVDGAYSRCGYTPLENVSLSGPGGGAGATSIGVSVTGVMLRFTGLRIWNFGRGFDVSHSNTWLISLVDSTIRNCQTCYHLDNETSGASTAGEQMVITRCTFFNSATAINASGNGVHLEVTGTSIDYCGRSGTFSNPWAYFSGCHIESNGNTTISYMFHVANNSKVSFVNTDVVMGSGTNPLNYLFNPSVSPANFGNGQAHFSQVKVYAQNPAGGDVTWNSDQTLVWPSGATTTSHFTPFPLRWAPLSAQFVAQDFFPQDAATIRVTSMPSNGAVGQFTLTASAAPADIRTYRVRLG